MPESDIKMIEFGHPDPNQNAILAFVFGTDYVDELGNPLPGPTMGICPMPPSFRVGGMLSKGSKLGKAANWIRKSKPTRYIIKKLGPEFKKTYWGKILDKIGDAMTGGL